jgi:hypothetical protein
MAYLMPFLSTSTAMLSAIPKGFLCLALFLSLPQSASAQHAVGKSFFGNRLDASISSQYCQNASLDHFKRRRAIGIERESRKKVIPGDLLTANELQQITQRAEEEADAFADSCVEPVPRFIGLP